MAKLKIAVIPDGQTKKGVPLEHWTWVGKYLAKKRPDVIVNIGDFADMPSLSSYDVGKLAFEGRRYRDDIEAAHEAMGRLMSPIQEEMRRLNRPGRKKKTWYPQLELTYGNHEERIDRAIQLDRKLEGLISKDDLGYKEFGWNTHEFLEVAMIGGIAFSHYFTTGVAGRPCASAQAMINKKHQSCIAGHQQGRQVAYATRADGSCITAIIAGSCYQHEEDFMGAQGNRHWRGIVMLHEVEDGTFDEMFVSLEYLKRQYGAA